MRLALIPARGGSVRIPHKNSRLFFGRPIISYSIEAARKSHCFDEIVVSTDDSEIADIARSCGADVLMRPAELSGPVTGTQEVMAHVLKDIPCEFACCIYATAPLLSEKTLSEAFDWLRNRGCNYVVPVGHWLQDPGQFYFGEANAFRFNRPLIGHSTMMLPVDPKTCIDINTIEDWYEAERRYAKLHNLLAPHLQAMKDMEELEQGLITLS